jgi:hypothetical protein
MNARNALETAWSTEIEAARAMLKAGDAAGEWRALERAHILSQPMAVPHVRTHFLMIRYATRHRDFRELAGQLFRLIVAGPGSFTGRYPAGNTGGANVSAFAAMPIPEDLSAFLQHNTQEA